jgi:hypothetical protein
VGEGRGEGYSCNVPLAAGIRDEPFLHLLAPIAEAARESFRPAVRNRVATTTAQQPRRFLPRLALPSPPSGASSGVARAARAAGDCECWCSRQRRSSFCSAARTPCRETHS